MADNKSDAQQHLIRRLIRSFAQMEVKFSRRLWLFGGLKKAIVLATGRHIWPNGIASFTIWRVPILVAARTVADL